MADTVASFAETLTGRIAPYQELLAMLDEVPGLTVVSCDPFSGTSMLLAAAAEEAHQRCVLVDVRRCGDTLDLAMAIADAAVGVFEGESAPWWTSDAMPSSTAALRLARTLSDEGLDPGEIRTGSGDPLVLLEDALHLTVVLADGPVTVILDHLGPLLWQQGTANGRKLLGALRAIRQRFPQLVLALVEYSDGSAVKALKDRQHPMYQAGGTVEIRRARPEEFRTDLIITRPTTRVSPALLLGCADLAHGVPALTWRTVELAPPDPHAATAALAGWRTLRRLTEPETARQWDTLRRVHPLAQTIVAVTANGLRPHSIAANDKSINDGLQVMRALGLAWQPKPRSWEIADPLLIAYARDHAQPWVTRRRSSAPIPLDDATLKA
jgi:hypothetical protein